MLFTPTIDDGVIMFAMMNAYCVNCAMLLEPTVKTRVRVPDVYSTLPAVGALLLGVVKVIVGALLVPDVSTDGVPPSMKRQPRCAPDSAGNTNTILPPVSTRPAVVNVTVATDSYAGVSVAVANVADSSAPATMWSVAIDDVVSTFLS